MLASAPLNSRSIMGNNTSRHSEGRKAHMVKDDDFDKQTHNNKETKERKLLSFYEILDNVRQRK